MISNNGDSNTQQQLNIPPEQQQPNSSTVQRQPNVSPLQQQNPDEIVNQIQQLMGALTDRNLNYYMERTNQLINKSVEVNARIKRKETVVRNMINEINLDINELNEMRTEYIRYSDSGESESILFIYHLFIVFFLHSVF